MTLVKLATDDKSEMQGIIRRAKSSHIRWRAYAQGLVAGVPVQEDRLPVRHTDCRFGQWYYGEGTRIFGHLDIFRDIEGAHEMLHSIYQQIYELVARGHTDKANAKLAELIGVSRTLIEQIELLEAEVEALG